MSSENQENQENSKSKNSQTFKTISYFVGGAIVGGIITAAMMGNSGPGADEALIVVDGKTYTASTLPGDARFQYAQLDNSIYNAKKSFAAQTALRIALAADAGKKVSDSSLPTFEELIIEEPASEQEAKDYYNQVVKKMGSKAFNGQSFEKLKPELKKQLGQQKMRATAMNKLQTMMQSSRVQMLLPPPPPPPMPTAPAVAPVPPAAPAANAPEASATKKAPAAKNTQQK